MRAAANFLFRKGVKTAGMLRNLHAQGRLATMLGPICTHLQVPVTTLVAEVGEELALTTESQREREAEASAAMAAAAEVAAASGVELAGTSSSVAARLEPGELALTLPAHGARVTALAATEKLFFTSGADGGVLAWSHDVKTAADGMTTARVGVSAQLVAPGGPAMRALCLAGGYLHVAGAAREVRRWRLGADLTKLNAVAPIVTPSEDVACLAAGAAIGRQSRASKSERAERLFCASLEIVSVWAADADAAPTKPDGFLKGHTSPVLTMAATARALYSGSSDKTVREWDLKSLQLVRAFVVPEFTAPVYALTATDDGSLFTGSSDLRLYSGCHCAQQLPNAHQGPVFAVAAAKGAVYSGGGDGAVKVWAHNVGASEPLQPQDEFVAAGTPREGRAPHHVGARARRRRRPPRRRRQQRRPPDLGRPRPRPRYRGWSKVGGELLDPAAFAQTSAKLGLGDTPVEDLDYVEDDEEIDETALAEQTLSGWLTKRSGPFNVTRRRFFIITEGTLSWHKNERDLATALGAITLRDCTIADPDDGSCVVAIKAPEKNYELEADDPAACGEWVSALRNHARLPPSRLYTSSQTGSLVRRRPSPPRRRRPRRPARPRDPPARRALSLPQSGMSRGSQESLEESEGGSPSPAGRRPAGPSKAPSVISNLRLKAEKKIASRAVASDLGKKVLKELAAPETFVILSSVQELSTRDPSIKPSINIENTILRIASKAHRRPRLPPPPSTSTSTTSPPPPPPLSLQVALLLQHGRLKMTSLHSIGAVSDALCLDLMRKYDALQRSGRDDLDPNHENVVERVRMLEADLVAALSPHMTPKNVAALCQVTGFIGSPERIQRILTEELFKPDVLKIVEALKVVYKLDMSAAAASARGKWAPRLAPPAICRAALWRLAARRRVEGGRRLAETVEGGRVRLGGGGGGRRGGGASDAVEDGIGRRRLDLRE